MRQKLAPFVVLIAVLMPSFNLDAQAAQNQNISQWQVKHLKNSERYSEAHDTSPIYSEEYMFENCSVFLRRDKAGVRIFTHDFEWRRGEMIQGGAKEKILGLGQLIDITKQGDESIKVEVEFHAEVEVLEDYGLSLNGTVILPRGSNVTLFLRKEDGEREVDIFYNQCREAVRELPQEVRSAFFGYAGIE